MSGAMHNPKCFASHVGHWLIEPKFFSAAVGAIRAGTMPMKPVAMEDYDEEPRKRDPFQLVDGVAVIQLDGAMMKGSSKYGGTTSTVLARQDIRAATAASKVKAIVLLIDSPGGHVNGTEELAHEIDRANLAKPVAVHAEGMLASAAYWIAAGASEITASPMSEIGSIGVYAVAYDTSEMMKADGVRVVLMKAGKHKGDFVDGLPITKDMIERHQARIDEINAAFVSAIAAGRGVSLAQAMQWNTGELWGAQAAVSMGLIDRIGRLPDAITNVRRMAEARRGKPIASATHPAARRLDRIIATDNATRAARVERAAAAIRAEERARL